MAYYASNLFLLVTTLLALSSTLHPCTARPSAVRPGGPASLAERLKIAGGSESPNCWDSLIELQACTGEVILFFLNGETYLGPSCCRAIRVIGQQCWPAMFGSIGFTAEEADVLQGFCDGLEARSPPPPPPVLPPVDQPSAHVVFP